MVVLLIFMQKKKTSSNLSSIGHSHIGSFSASKGQKKAGS